MPIFQKSVLIEAPQEKVFAFHERKDALKLLSPSFPPIKILRTTGSLQPGSVVELKVGPFHWTALHTAYEKNRFFEDRQARGFFAEWIHRHEFSSENGGTRLTEVIRYRLPGGALINAFFGWAVQLALHQMFAQRHRITKRYCESEI